MSDTLTTNEASLEVVSPDGSRRTVRITAWPFVIGRGGETGNHLQLADPLISRQCAAIVSGNGQCHIEDRGNRQGIFLNGNKIEKNVLEEGDVISFGVEDSYKVIFHAAATQESIQGILSRIEHLTGGPSSSDGLRKLNLLLEATSLLHSQLPLDSVLAKMIDHAIAMTDADRGLLQEAVEGNVCGHARAARARRRWPALAA